MSFQEGNEVWFFYAVADRTVRYRCRITRVCRLQNKRVPGASTAFYDLDYQWAPTVFARAITEDRLEHVSVIDRLGELAP